MAGVIHTLPISDYFADFSGHSLGKIIITALADLQR
jgi:hypothetical protein